MFNWTVSAWPILASAALKSTLVLGAAWLITYLLRGRSAAARHMVWTACGGGAGGAAVALRGAARVARADGQSRCCRPIPGIVFRTTRPPRRSDAGTRGDARAGARQSNGRDARAGARRAIDGKDALMLLWMAGIAAGLLQMLAASAMLWRTRRAARVSPDQDDGGRAGLRAWASSIRSRCWRRRRGCP